MRFLTACVALSFATVLACASRPLDYDVPLSGLGLGERCASSGECRSGLNCLMGTCQTAGTTALGMACTITLDCAGNAICGRSGTCEPAGDVPLGGTCTDTSSCVRGGVCFRSMPGLYGVCRAPRGTVVRDSDGGVMTDDAGSVNIDGGSDGGTGSRDSGVTGSARDLGGRCADLLDCLAGLACDETTHTCLRGVPGGGLPTYWPGEQCNDSAGRDAGMAGTRAYFEIPAADGTPPHDFFRLPFPNDIRRDAMTTRINLRGFPRPGARLLGFDVVDRYVQQSERDLDGFGTNQTVFFRFSSNIDFGTLRLDGSAATIRMIDLTTGQPTNSIRYGANTGGNRYLCPNYLTIETGSGSPMEPGHTYVAYITTGIRDAMSRDIVRDPGLVEMLADTAPTEPVHLRAWNAYAPFRRYLMMQSLAASTILNAAVFTTQQARRVVPLLRDVVRAQPMTMPTGFVRCDTGVRSPCDDGLTGAAHIRGCLGAADPNFEEIQGQVDVPVFQRGERPYTMLPSGGIVLDAMGRPMVQSTERVCVTITVPRGPIPAAGWAVVLYSHGTGGNYRSVITEGLARQFANIDLGGGTTSRVATIGYEGVMHGARRGVGVTDSPDTLFFNFANPEAARDNVLQGAADVFAMVRALETLSLPMLPMAADTTRFDPRHIFFFGHSQGGTVGVPALAYEPNVAAIVLSGTGGDLRVSLTTKRRPVDIASLTPLVLQEISVDASHPALNVFQAFIEPADAANYGRLLMNQRPMGVPLRSILQTYGLGDTFSTPGTMQVVAGTIGLPAAGMIPGGMMAWPGGMPLALPVMGNIRQGAETATAALIEADPMGAYDGHFIAFRDMPTNQRVMNFVGTATTAVPTLR